MMLEAAGHEVHIEHDSHRALEHTKLDALQVCILDIGLPDIDGNELAKQLRMLPKMSGAKLIALTG